MVCEVFAALGDKLSLWPFSTFSGAASELSLPTSG